MFSGLKKKIGMWLIKNEIKDLETKILHPFFKITKIQSIEEIKRDYPEYAQQLDQAWARLRICPTEVQQGLAKWILTL